MSYGAFAMAILEEWENEPKTSFRERFMPAHKIDERMGVAWDLLFCFSQALSLNLVMELLSHRSMIYV